MKKILFYLLGTLPLTTLAQSSFDKKVTAILHKGDTIQGLMQDKEWFTNPEKVWIQKLNENVPTLFKADEIQWLWLENGERYLGANIKIDQTPSQFESSNLDTAQIQSRSGYHFLLLEFAGDPFSLYSFNQQGRQHFYWQRNRDTPVELLHRKYTIRQNGATIEREDNSYLTALNEMVFDCPQARSLLSNMSYDQQRLIKLFSTYYQSCGNAQSAQSFKKKAGTVSFIALGGLANTSVEFEQEGTLITTPPAIIKSGYQSSTSFSFGAGVQYNFERNHQRIGLELDLLYLGLKSSGSDESRTTNPNTIKIKTVDLDINYLNTDISALVRLGKRNSIIRPFLRAGLGGAFVLSENSKGSVTEWFNGSSTTIPFVVFNENLKSLQIAVLLGAGLQWNRFILDYRFRNVGNMLKSANYSGGWQAHSFLVGFRF